MVVSSSCEDATEQRIGHPPQQQQETLKERVFEAATRELLQESLQMIVDQEEMRIQEAAQTLMELFPTEVKTVNLDEVISGKNRISMSEDTKQQLLWLLSEADDATSQNDTKCGLLGKP